MAEKKGYVAPDGRIFCWDEGFRCIVAMQSAETSGDFVFKFISAKMTADPTLDELSNRLTTTREDGAAPPRASGAASRL